MINEISLEQLVDGILQGDKRKLNELDKNMPTEFDSHSYETKQRGTFYTESIKGMRIRVSHYTQVDEEVGSIGHPYHYIETKNIHKIEIYRGQELLLSAEKCFGGEHDSLPIKRKIPSSSWQIMYPKSEEES